MTLLDKLIADKVKEAQRGREEVNIFEMLHDEFKFKRKYL